MAKRPGTVPILRDVKTRSAKLAPSQSHRRPNGQRGRPQAASAGLVPAPVAAPVAGLTGVAGPLEEPAPAVLPGRQAAWMGARSRSISARFSPASPYSCHAMAASDSASPSAVASVRSAASLAIVSGVSTVPPFRGYAALGRGVVGCHAGAAARRPAAQRPAADRVRNRCAVGRARQSVALTCAARRQARHGARRRRPAIPPGSRARRRAGRGP